MKLHQKLFLILLFFLPSQFGKHFWFDWSSVFGIRVDYLAPAMYLTDVLIILLMVVWFLSSSKKQFKTSKKMIALFLTILVFIFVNIFFANVWQVALYRWLKVGEFVFLSFYVWSNWKNLQDKIYLPLALSSAYTFLIAGLQFVNQKTTGGLFYFLGERSFNTSTPGIALLDFFGQQLLRPYATFSHPNSLGGYFLFVFILLYLSLSYAKAQYKKIALVGLVFSVCLILLSFSKLVIITFCLLILMFLIHKFLKVSSKFFQRLFQIFVVSAFLFSIYLPILATNLLNQNARVFPETIERRLQLAVVAAETIYSSRVLTGVGLGNFVTRDKITYRERRLGISNDIYWFFQPVHNLPLLVLNEVGVFGGVGFLILLLKSSKNKKYLGLMFVLLLTGLGDHYWLTMQQNFLLLAVAVGIICSSDTITSWTKKA